MSDKITPKIIKELTAYWGKEFITFSKKGMTLHYRGRLKSFFEQEEHWDIDKAQLIENELDFDKHYGAFRDFVLGGSGAMEYCQDNNELYPHHFGLTNAPLFSFGGMLWNQDKEPIKYAFLYFCNYQITDWVEVLIREKKVTFETFIDNGEEYDVYWDNVDKRETLTL